MLGQRLNVSLSDARQTREHVSLDELFSGLLKPKILDWTPPRIDSRDIMPTVQELVPLGPDVVQWMQEATAILSILETAAESYHQAGSQIAIAAGDAYSPGVSTTGVHAVSISGNAMRSQGFGQCIMNGQVFNIPANGKMPLIGANFLGWASIPSIGSGVQWIMALLNWLELAMAPITSKIPFPSISGGSVNALVAPQFLLVSTKLPTPIHQLFLGFQSNKAQLLNLTGRSAGNYTIELFNLNLNVPEGESSFTVIVRGLPIVPPYVLQMQPADDTQTVLVGASTRPM